MTAAISRRRAITVLASAAAGLVMPRTSAATAGAHAWRGVAMGAEARIVFSGVDRATARRAATMAAAEIERLERALSLFRFDSEICRLNSDKSLSAPGGDFRRALGLGLDVARRTGGLFDPTVQSLWQFYADWFAADPAAAAPPASQVAPALAAVGWRRIVLGSDRVRLGSDQSITLNGLGQGYVTDRIAGLLRDQGFEHVLVDLGEQHALGARVDGTPWPVARAGGGIDLRDGALATSEARGCILGADGAVHHLFDPRTGRSAGSWRILTVHHRSAAVADALSTAFYAASPGEIAKLSAAFEGATVWATDLEGREWRFGARSSMAVLIPPPDGPGRAR